MSIEAEITVTLAEVHVDDEYQIELLTPHGPSTSLGWDDAAQLANELLEAVEQAKRMMSDDFPRIHPAGISHGFDVTTPESAVTQEAALDSVASSVDVCRDCQEGKHGACNGRALVEDGGVLLEVDCQCPDPDGHRGDGSAS